jgi:hypothetical protein
VLIITLDLYCANITNFSLLPACNMGTMSSKTNLSAGEPSAKRRSISSAPEASTHTITKHLPNDVIQDIFGTFLGPGHYRYVAATCRDFRTTYEHAMSDAHRKKTTWTSAAASVACAELCLNESGSIEGISLAAARSGQLAVLELAYSRGCRSIKGIALAGARMGQLEVLEWALNRGYWSADGLFGEAGRGGQVSVFEWAVKNGLKWEFLYSAISAAGAGHVMLLEWMWEHGALNCTFNYCGRYAAKGGHVPVLEWIKRRGLPFEHYIESCWIYAARNGHVPVLDWLMVNGHVVEECVDNCWIAAAGNGRVVVLDWLWQNGQSVNSEIMNVAARHRPISDSEWARYHQVGWSSKTFCLAACHGELTALEWLRRQGCPWDGNVIHWAQEMRHFHVVEWARIKGCPTEAEHIYSVGELDN